MKIDAIVEIPYNTFVKYDYDDDNEIWSLVKQVWIYYMM